MVQPEAVKDDVLTETEVELAVQGLKGGIAGGLSGIIVEDLKEWRKEDKWEKDPEGRRCNLVVRLVQVMFRDGTVTEEIAWENMVLIQKGKGEYRGIGLVEVLWKVCSVVVSCRLEKSVVLHDTLHGFREGRGMGKTTMEANMHQKLEGIAHEPLFQVFLYFQKAYDSLDRERCLELLRGYGMGPNLAQLLENYWRRQRIVPEVGKYLGTAVGEGRGVTQGNPA